MSFVLIEQQTGLKRSDTVDALTAQNFCYKNPEVIILSLASYSLSRCTLRWNMYMDGKLFAQYNAENDDI